MTGTGCTAPSPRLIATCLALSASARFVDSSNAASAPATRATACAPTGPRSRSANHRQPKDSGADRFPFVDIDANRAWFAIACFADALVRWFQLLCLTAPLAAAEPKTPALAALARPCPARASRPAEHRAHSRRLAHHQRDPRRLPAHLPSHLNRLGPHGGGIRRRATPRHRSRDTTRVLNGFGVDGPDSGMPLRQPSALDQSRQPPSASIS